MWHSTYLSPEFRIWARDRVAEWMKLPEGSPIEYVSYLQDNDVGSFLVAIYTPRGYPPINVAADHFWDLTLDLPNGQSFKPESIEVIEVTERERRLFPYLDQWSTFYRIKFPVYSLDRPFSMSLRSAAVTSVLEWKQP